MILFWERTSLFCGVPTTQEDARGRSETSREGKDDENVQLEEGDAAEEDVLKHLQR